jgi:uncharacterized membrane protein YqjE
VIAWAIIVCLFLALAYGAGLGVVAFRLVAFVATIGVIIWSAQAFGEMAMIGSLCVIAAAAALYAIFGDYYSDRMVEDRRANAELREYHKDRARREKRGWRD